MMILAPRDARWREMARPMPREPPVTIATRSWSGRKDWVIVCAAAFDSVILEGKEDARDNGREDGGVGMNHEWTVQIRKTNDRTEFQIPIQFAYHLVWTSLGYL